MPLTDAIGTVFAAAFDSVFLPDTVWLGVAADRSAELAWGDSIRLNSSTYDTDPANVTAANARSTNAANHLRTPHVGDVGMATLTLDQYKGIDELIPVHAANQIRPSLIAEKGTQAAHKMMEEISDHIRATFNAQTGAPSVLAQVSVASNAWGQTAHQDAVLDALQRGAQSLTEAYVPRMNRVAVVSPAVFTVISKALVEKNLFVPGLTGGAAARAVPNYAGMDIIEDNDAGAGTAATDDAKHTMYFLQRGQGLSAAYRMEGMRTVQSEQYRGWRLIADFNYGAVVNQPNKVRLIKMNIT